MYFLKVMVCLCASAMILVYFYPANGFDKHLHNFCHFNSIGSVFIEKVSFTNSQGCNMHVNNGNISLVPDLAQGTSWGSFVSNCCPTRTTVLYNIDFHYAM